MARVPRGQGGCQEQGPEADACMASVQPGSWGGRLGQPGPHSCPDSGSSSGPVRTCACVLLPAGWQEAAVMFQDLVRGPALGSAPAPFRLQLILGNCMPRAHRGNPGRGLRGCPPSAAGNDPHLTCNTRTLPLSPVPAPCGHHSWSRSPQKPHRACTGTLSRHALTQQLCDTKWSLRHSRGEDLIFLFCSPGDGTRGLYQSHKPGPLLF